MKRSREDEPETEAGSTSASSAPAPSRQVVDARMALGGLPSTEMYEQSFMHRDNITHIVVTASDFVITASKDGQVKFWKKMQVRATCRVTKVLHGDCP